VTRTSVPPRAPRVRLDQLLVERGLVESRARAQALLMAGRVRVGAGDGARLDRKPGDLVGADVAVEVAAPLPYVSRGGEKLAAALVELGVDPAGLVCLDVGASTGGFTDALLQRGAVRVHAIDVGRGQLAEALRRDARVISRERTNARELTPALLGEPVGLAVVDVSFISLGLVLAPIAACLAPGGAVVALVKPQFEAGRGRAPGGVVRDPAVHREVLAAALEHARDAGLVPVGLADSPLRGPAGNREFFLHAVAVAGRPTHGSESDPAEHGDRPAPAEAVDWAARIAALVPG
jgi:23S rRNA (cytidine1920-2'-O)/16S rRNA (cytidine1409-2'-O)-methyltransferase